MGEKFAEKSSLFSFDEAYREGHEKFEALATDFWNVLNILRTQYGMATLKYDRNGEEIAALP